MEESRIESFGIRNRAVSLETLSQKVHQKIDSARYSDSVFLMALSSVVGEQLFRLKTSPSSEAVESLKFFHEHFRVSLNLLYNLSADNKNRHELMFLFTAGYAVLQSDSFEP
jgi:hypothetical protein